MVHKGLQSSFVSLAWLWSGRSLPQGETVRVLVPWTGAQCGQHPQFSCHQISDQPKVWQVDNLLTWLVTWPIAAGWLTGYCTKYQPALPKAEASGAQCVTTLVRLTCGQMYSLVETSSGQEWYYIGPVFRSGWPFAFRSGWTLVRCTPQVEASSSQVRS